MLASFPSSSTHATTPVANGGHGVVQGGGAAITNNNDIIFVTNGRSQLTLAVMIALEAELYQERSSTGRPARWTGLMLALGSPQPQWLPRCLPRGSFLSTSHDDGSTGRRHHRGRPEGGGSQEVQPGLLCPQLQAPSCPNH